ncbi:MAG: hypothetical protein ACRD68_07660, partial [Pyrinomonadaceae bacterium]
SRQFKVTVRPRGPEYVRQLRASVSPRAVGAVPDGTRGLPTLPHTADAQVIEDGDSFTLDLLVNPQLGVKIVDVVKVSFDAPRESFPGNNLARDFTLNNVEMAISDHRLLINGGAVSGEKRTRGSTGALLWFYAPGRGRFIFSLMPREGYDFRKVGVIEDNRISFAWGGDRYEWLSGAPVVGKGGHWNLWVLHDPDYVHEGYHSPQAAPGARPEDRAGGAGEKLDELAEELRHPGGRDRHGFGAGRDKRSAAGTGTSAAKRARTIVGAADRIENLLPKN